MDLIGNEGIAYFHKVKDPNNQYGELIRCDFCGEVSEIYTEICPFCHRRFVNKKDKTLYIFGEEKEK